MHQAASDIGSLIIRPARLDEAELFLQILEEAEHWLHSKGNKQWVPGAHRPHASTFEKYVQDQTVFFALHDGQVVATSVLRQKPTIFWKERTRPAVYLSKLTSRRHLAGRRLGATMLNWSEQHSASLGAEAVRLDCWADNPRLCDFYRRAGYLDAGDAEGYGGYRLKLFEKCLTAG